MVITRTMWRCSGRTVMWRRYMGGGPGVEPHGLPYILHITNDQTMSDTWCLQIGSRVLIPFSIQQTCVDSWLANCQPTIIYHVTPIRSYGLYGPATSDHTDCTDCTVSIKIFAYLTWRTDRYISCSWRPFETKRVALGSKRRGLRSHMVWSDSDHFEFLSKIWSPDQSYKWILVLST